MSESTTVLVQTETVGATVIVTGATVIGTVPIGPQGPPGVITADDVVDLFTGTPDGTKFLRDDGTLAAPAGGGGGAPDDATYLVTTAHAGLSAEVAVGATPGGELGGTWASPTVDATHSGSSHAAVQAAAEATAAADATTKANAAQAAAVQRANHTGTQLAATISDLTEAVQDVVGAMATDGTTVNFTYDDTAGTLTAEVQGLTSANLSDFAEAVRDRLGATLVQGTGITVTVDDPGDTVTIACTITQYTDEMAQDAVGGILVDSTSIDFTYTDATPEITASVKDEAIQDIVGAMVSGGTETGIAVTYDDTNGRLDFVAEVTQAELDAKADDSAVVHDTGDETIAGVKTFSSDPIIPDEAYDATNWNGVLEPPTKNAVRDEMENRVAKATFPVLIGVALSDETTAITTGIKAVIHAPFAFTLTDVISEVSTVSSSGVVTVDVSEGAGAGTTLLSTKSTIDASEETSKTAATAVVISDSSIADAARLSFEVDTAGTGAKGLKCWLVGTRVLA